MSTLSAPPAVARRAALWQFLREEGDAWLFIVRTALSYFIALWLAMRLQCAFAQHGGDDHHHRHAPAVGHGAGQEFLSRARDLRRRGGGSGHRCRVPAAAQLVSRRDGAVDRPVCRRRHVVSQLQVLRFRAGRLQRRDHRAAGDRGAGRRCSNRRCTASPK